MRRHLAVASVVLAVIVMWAPTHVLAQRGPGMMGGGGQPPMGGQRHGFRGQQPHGFSGQRGFHGHQQGFHGHGGRGHFHQPFYPRVGYVWPPYYPYYGYYGASYYPGPAYYPGLAYYAPTAAYAGPVTYDSPAVYPSPPVYASPQVYGAPTTSMSLAPPMPSVVQFPQGRYELRGDGASSPHSWVWIPNPPAAPPAPPAEPQSQRPASTERPAERQPQVYRWTDEAGVLHFTNKRDAVPAPYRTSARPDTSL